MVPSVSGAWHPGSGLAVVARTQGAAAPAARQLVPGGLAAIEDDGMDVEALEQALARRGIRPVTYDVWLRVEEAEAELARSLGRGEQVGH